MAGVPLSTTTEPIPIVPDEATPHANDNQPRPIANNDNVRQRKSPQSYQRANVRGRVHFIRNAGELAAGLDFAHGIGETARRYYYGGDVDKEADFARSLNDRLTGQLGDLPRAQAVNNGLGFPAFSGPGSIERTNDALFLKTGEPLDFRTLEPAQLDEIVARPWPSAEAIQENAKKLDQARKARQQLKARAETNVEVRKDPCIVGRHRQLKQLCKTLPGEGSQSHHIVPDQFVRSGSRDGATQRILSEDDGAAICVPGNAFVGGTLHNAIHADLNKILADKVAKGESTDGTLPLSDVIGASLRVTIAYRLQCTAQIIREVGSAFAGVDTSQRVRVR